MLNAGYPVVLTLHGRRCVVVGGGAVAERRVKGLLTRAEPTGEVVVVSPRATDMIRAYATEGRVTWHSRVFQAADLDEAFLVFAATDDRSLNAEIAHHCSRRRILVNVADVPQEGSFRVPAVSAAGGIQVAVSTAGAAPTLGAELSREFAASCSEFGAYIEALARFRATVLERVDDGALRAELLGAACAPELIELVRAGRCNEALERLNELAARLPMERPNEPNEPNEA